MNTHNSITNATDSHKLLYASFNQGQGCFTICHENGFRVYSSDPLEMRVNRDFSQPGSSSSSSSSGSNGMGAGGGIGVAQMLHRTNYLALVGGGRDPKYSQNKVVIWDDLKQRPALSLEFLSAILNVKLSRSRIVVVLRNKVHVYAFSSPPTRLAAYETVDNPLGIVAMTDNTVAFPSRTEGQIQIVKLQDEPSGTAAAATATTTTTTSTGGQLVSIVRAHRSPIRCLALNPQGTVLASASEHGTIIRLHSTQNTQLLHEFRRGLDRAVIYSINFSPKGSRLAVLSDKNTLHVFDTSALVPTSTTVNSQSAISTGSGGIEASNRTHVLKKLPLLPSYFSSQWSFASIHVDGSRGVVGWSSESTVIIVWTENNCKWEKYVIVERETGGAQGEKEGLEVEILREAWRGFDGLSG